jgi:hypothetical protein
VQQQQQEQPVQHQQHQQGSPKLQCSSNDRLSIAVSCLQAWAQLQQQASTPPAGNATSPPAVAPAPAPAPAPAQGNSSGSSSSSSSSTLHGAHQQPQQSASCPSQGLALEDVTMAQGPSALSAHPLLPWGPVRPAGLPPFVAKQAQGTAAAAAGMDCEGQFGDDSGVDGAAGMMEPGAGGGSGALRAVPVCLIVEAAASTAAWALKAYQEQQRWFPA